MVKFRETEMRGEEIVADSISSHGISKRRGVRVNSCVPVAVEWDSGSDNGRSEGKTRVVGPYGCMALLPHKFEVAQRIRVINLVSQEGNPAVVVWRGQQRPEGWEFGIELSNPEMGFWGLEL